MGWGVTGVVLALCGCYSGVVTCLVVLWVNMIGPFTWLYGFLDGSYILSRSS